MAEIISAIYKTATGDLVSVDSSLATKTLTDAELAAVGLARVVVASVFDATHVWDSVTRTQKVVAKVVGPPFNKTAATWTLADVALAMKILAGLPE